LPLVIHPRIRRNARRVALMTALACFGVTGSALAACPTGATTEPFTQFGDTADYALAPGGSFEDGASGWLLNNNAIADGNESFFANTQSDSQSLTMGPASSVISAPICVDPTTPYLRLFAKKLTGNNGSLRVDVLYTDANGVVRSGSAGRLILGGPAANGDYTRWSPSPILKLGSLLPLSIYPNQTTTVQLRISTDLAQGNWAIDDVYIDPYRA
jgi:hypothetical protein